MKTKKALFFIVLIFGILLPYCKKDTIDPNEWVRGRWVNEFSDTICFSSTLMLIDKMPYMFKIGDDSLKVKAGWNNSLQEFGHKIEINESEDELYIYDFLMHDKSIFKRLLLCDCYDLK